MKHLYRILAAALLLLPGCGGDNDKKQPPKKEPLPAEVEHGPEEAIKKHQQPRRP